MKSLTALTILFLGILFSCQNSSETSTRPDFQKKMDTLMNWENYEWTVASIREYEYDRKGNLSSHSMKYWGKDDWREGRYVQNTYDKNNSLVESIKYWSGRTSKELRDRVKNSYDEDSRLILSTSERFMDSSWVLSNKDTLVYNNKGLLSEKLHTTYHKMGNFTDLNRLYLYDSLDRIINRTHHSLGDNKISHTSIVISKYDSLSRLSQTQIASCKNNDTTIYNVENRYYDELNNLIERQTLNHEGAHYVNSFKTLSIYDTNSNAIKRTSQIWINGLWVNRNETRTTYKRR